MADKLNKDELKEAAGAGYWDDYDVYVDCPYCGKGFLFQYDGKHDTNCPACGKLIRVTQGEGNPYPASTH